MGVCVCANPGMGNWPNATVLLRCVGSSITFNYVRCIFVKTKPDAKDNLYLPCFSK